MFKLVAPTSTSASPKPGRASITPGIDNYIHIIRYDKLIIDDQVYIYNDSEKRIEKLPFSVYSTAATGTISSNNISHSTSHSNLYTTNASDSRDESAPDPDQPTLLRYFNISISNKIILLVLK